MTQYHVVAISDDGTVTRIEVEGCYRDIATVGGVDNSALLQSEADALAFDLAKGVANPDELKDRPLQNDGDGNQEG